MSSVLVVEAIGGGVAGGRERLSVESDGTAELSATALLDPRDRAGRWAAPLDGRGGLEAVLRDLPDTDPDTELPPGATALEVTLADGRSVSVAADVHAAAPPWRPLVQWWRSTRTLLLAHPVAVVRLQAAVVAGAVRFTVTNPGSSPIDVAIDEAGFAIVTPRTDGSWAETWRNPADDRLGLITTDGRILGGVLMPARLDGGAVVQAAFVTPPPAPSGAFVATMRGELRDPSGDAAAFSLAADAA